MKALRIDFGDVRGRAPWWSIVLFLVGLLACVSGVWRFAQAQANLADAQAVAALGRSQFARTLTSRVVEPAFTLPASEIAAVNRAIETLNLPWEGLFATIERLQSKDVALLTLEPDGGKRVVRLVAEARDAVSMLVFVKQLESTEFLGPGASLVKHEINLQDPDQPYRFEATAPWRGAR